MADGEGFEPPRGVNLCRFSRPVPSTTRPPIRDSEIKYLLAALNSSSRHSTEIGTENLNPVAIRFRSTRLLGRQQFVYQPRKMTEQRKVPSTEERRAVGVRGMIARGRNGHLANRYLRNAARRPSICGRHRSRRSASTSNLASPTGLH